MFDFDKVHEECGVFGVYAKSEQTDVVMNTYFALYALQHRGQQACGIAVNDDGVITCYKQLGLVPDIFTGDVLTKLGTGKMAVGHVLYSNTGSSGAVNAQPLVVRHVKGSMSLVNNGSLVNAMELREKLEMDGCIFHTTNDAEVISYMITRARLKSASIEEAIEKAMPEIKGAYSMIIMSPKKMIAVRDPEGMRPLSIGTMPDGSYVFSSETCGFDTIGAKFMRDLRPGEIVVCDENGLRSIETHCGSKGKLCVFEFVYIARPDSVIEGTSVHEARLRAGAFLALEHPVHADVVIGAPDSGVDAAIGFARQSGIPYGMGFIKNRYVGRTFIQPTQAMRENAVHIKLNAIASTVKDKRVVLIDDSIVRGTTCKRTVKLLKDAGAKEVHLRISAPPFTNPCYFGVDIDSCDKLIACKMTLDEIKDFLGVDSLGYLSIDSVKKLAAESKCDFCVGCFNGEYPVEAPKQPQTCKFDCKISENKKNS